MYLRYDDFIAESPGDLLRLERQHRASPVAARLKMLRLLKGGAYRSRRALASVLGYSERQLHRWFEAYRGGGIGVDPVRWTIFHFRPERSSCPDPDPRTRPRSASKS